MTRTRPGRQVFQWMLIGVACGGGVALGQAAPSRPTTRPAPAAQRVTPSHTSVLEQKDARPSGVLPGRPDAAEIGGDLLGERFESKGLGISLRPPRGMTPVRKIGSGDVIDFVDTQRNWTLKISKTRMPEPTQLLSQRGPNGATRPGLLDATLDNVRGSLGKMDVLRKDVTNIGANDVGLLAIRYTKELQTQLTQQAIIQASDRLFYLVALTTPVSAPPAATQPAGAPAAAPDPREALAAATFRQLLDSTQLLDLTAIRREQDERLIHTRSLLVNFTPARVQAAMIPEQWIRVMQDGKDIGYVYTVEEPASGIPAPLTADERRAGKTKPNVPTGDGVLVGTRSWTMGADGIEIESESWMFNTADLRHEDWTVASVLRKAAATVAHTTEIGVSDRRRLRSGLDEYILTVKQVDNSGTPPPIERSLPPFYLPRAMSHLLPRLVPITQPKGYLFYSYVSDQKELVSRYIDVMPEQRVTFNGQSVRAVLIRDHYGLEGAVTTHYLAPDGRYLGTENKEAKLLMLPTDEKTLRSVWKDAKLNRPEGVKGGAQAAAPQPAATTAQPAAAAVKPTQTPARTPPANRQRPANAR